MEQLLQYFTPETYKLKLEFNRQSESITGEVKIYGEPHADIIKLHCVDIKIKNIEARKVAESDENLIYKNFSEFSPCDFEQKGDILEIKNIFQTKNDEKPGKIELEINFENKINQNLQGCYLSSYFYNNKKEKIITTQFESHYARECFPCIDEPAAKAQFVLELILSDYENGDVVLANTELINETNENNKHSFTFAPTPHMSTYLLAWVIGKFQKVETTNQHGVKVASYCALNQNLSMLEFANEVAARALDYYDEKFGIKYPLNKLDQVALPDFEAGAMENWGLVTYRESCMLAEPNAAIDTKQSVALTVTHELSHQWFGDLVTMEWWNDLWLNESFATIMEFYATDTLYPEFQAWQDFYTSDCVAALRRDCLPGVQAVQQEVHDPAEIATLFDSAIVYAKGARLILMLIKIMGEDNFYHGVKDYFQKYQYQNTVGDNLWECLQAYAEFDVKDFMYAWISQSGYPALQFSQNGDTTWWDQQRFLIDGATDDTKWPLPEVKDDMSGHYLLDLSTEEFNTKLSQYDTLNIEQKLRLLIDRMLLAKSRAVSSTSLVNLLPKFVDENAAVWDILLNLINDLKIFFVPDSAAEDTYREFLRKVSGARAREIGMTAQLEDSADLKRLRATLAVISRFDRDMEVIEQLAAQYNNDLAQIDAEMRGNILMAKIMIDENSTFATLLGKYQTEIDPEIKDDILGSLATAREESNIAKMIDLLKQPEIVRAQDHLFLFIYLLRNSKAKAQALNWLYANWEYVEQMTGDKSIEDYPRCMAGYIATRDEARRFYDFFSQMEDKPVFKRTLAMARASIESRLNLTEKESTGVQAAVKEYLGE